MKIRTIVLGIVTLIYISHPGDQIIGKPPLLTPQQDAYYEQGSNYLNAKRCSEAVEAFKKSIAIRPTTGAYNDLGRAYYCLKSYPEAEASFKQAIRLNPDNVRALYNLGFAYCHSVKIEEAKNVLQILRSKDPQSARDLQTEIDQAMVAKNQMAEADAAIAAAKKALEASRVKDTNYVTEGDKYREAGNNVKAIEAYKKAISIRASSDAYNGLGIAYGWLKQYSNAEYAFQQAIRLEANDSILHQNLGATYVEMGLNEKSEGPLKEALRLKPDNADALNWIGVARFRMKRYPEAAADFQKAIRLTPQNAWLYHNLGKTYFLMGRKEEAQLVYRKLLTLDKDVAQKLYEVMNPTNAAGPASPPPASGATNAESYRAQGDNYWTAKDYPRAIQAYKKAIALNPLLADGHIGLGRSHFDLKQFHEALASFRVAARLQPANHRALYWVGQAYFELKEIPKALQAFQQAVRLKPDVAEYQFEVGMSYYVLEAFPDAIAALTRAIQLKPDDAQAYYFLGSSHVGLGEKQQAMQVYRTLLRLDRQRAQRLLEQINKQP